MSSISRAASRRHASIASRYRRSRSEAQRLEKRCWRCGDKSARWGASSTSATAKKTRRFCAGVVGNQVLGSASTSGKHHRTKVLSTKNCGGVFLDRPPSRTGQACRGTHTPKAKHHASHDNQPNNCNGKPKAETGGRWGRTGAANAADLAKVSYTGSPL